MRCWRASIALEAFVRVPEGVAGFRGEAEVAVFSVWTAFPAERLDGFFLFKEFIVLSLSWSRRSTHKQTRHSIW
jgi:hypothetical protein